MAEVKEDRWASAEIREVRETVINIVEDEDTVNIYTASTYMANRLLNNPAAKQIKINTLENGDITGMEFEVPKWVISIRSKRRVLTPEQREAAAARLRGLSVVPDQEPEGSDEEEESDLPTQ